MITESKHFSKIIWGGAIFLLVATLIIPRVDFSLQQDSPRANMTPDPFDDRIVELENRLHDGRLSKADPEISLMYATALKARALTDAGPMTSAEIVWTVEQLDDYQSQIADQPTAASQQALREHRNDLILDELPRLDRQQATDAFDSVRRAYLDAFGVDPAKTASLPEQ